MASKPARIPGSIRFGEDFEFDFRAYKLRRSGRVLKLERIPTEVLAVLVEQRGELVTREQIAEKIWGKGVFLDTDNGINGAIRKVRQVLKDDPEQPRFIQTITGRGYRFIAPVIDPEPDKQVATPAPQPPVSERLISKSAHRRWPVLLGIAICLIAVVGAWFRWSHSRVRSQPPAQRLMLAVLPFENLTGDDKEDYFSDGMTEEMITHLGRLDPQHLGVIARTSVMHYMHSWTVHWRFTGGSPAKK